SESAAVGLGARLDAAGYDVRVIDVEVPFELSESRIRSRWEHSYTNALEGGDSLGGRWVPSEYARDVFDGPDKKSKPEAAAQRLAQECPAVSRYRVFRTGPEQVTEGRAQPNLEVDLSRSSRGAALVDVSVSRVQRSLDASRPTRRNMGRSGDGIGRG